MDSFSPLIVFLGLGLMAISGVAVLILFRLRAAGEQAQTLIGRQAELSGQLGQIANEAAMRQEQLRNALDTRLAQVTAQVSDNLRKENKDNRTALESLKERLAVIDAAQKNIAELSGQMVSLQEILSNKQARGAFGEIQLNDLIISALPPDAYSFQHKLTNGKIADCLLTFPNPPGSIAIDSKFPLEGYQALCAARDSVTRIQAGKVFGSHVSRHVKDIANRYIVPGETADSALMFLPSEAIYAELHANFRAVVEEAFRRRVWIVSPTTLMATLNTVRAVLKDARMREQAGVIQAEVGRLANDVGRLDDRVEKLQRHFELASDYVRQIRISTEKVVRQATRIEEVEMGKDSSEEISPDSAKPSQTITSEETTSAPGLANSH